VDFGIILVTGCGSPLIRRREESGDISEVEVRIIRRFLETVCDPKLFAKFGFEEFFQFWSSLVVDNFQAC
jgi:hypothetical protein